MPEFVPLDGNAFTRGMFLINQSRLTKAQTEETIANTEAKRVESAMKQDALKRTQSFLGKIAGLGSPAAVAATNPPLIPGTDVPDATAELADANGQPRPARTPPTNLLALAKKPKPWEVQMQEADRNDALAKAAEQSGLLEVADKYRDDARAGREQATKHLETQSKVEAKTWEEAYNMASAVKDDGSFQYVMSQLEQKQEGLPQQLGFQRGDDGKFIFDDAAVAKVASIKDLALSQKDRLEQEHKAAELAERIEERKRKEKKDEDLNTYRDQLAAARQSGDTARAELIQARIDALKATQDRGDARLIESRTKSIQTTLDKNDAIKLFPKYEQAFNTARMINEEIKADTKYRNIDAPQIESLTQAYRNMASGFRARAGGQWEQKNIASFNGLSQKVEKWLATIGKGTPAVNRTTAMQVYDAMENMYGIAASEALKAEMTARDSARRRGADPDSLQYRAYGDMSIRDRLAKGGLLIVKEKDATGRPLKVEIAGKIFDVSKDLED